MIVDRVAQLCVLSTVIPMVTAACAYAISGRWRMAVVFLCYGIANGMLSLVRG